MKESERASLRLANAGMELRDAVFKYCIYYPVVYARREYVPYHLSRLKRTQWCSGDELSAMQGEKLGKLLSYAATHVPYYRERFKWSVRSGMKPLDSIGELPLLDKEMLRTATGMLVSRQRFLGVTKKTTGGSTGKSVTVWKAPDAMGQELAAAWRGFSWAGIDIGHRQGRFWGVPFTGKDRVRARLIDFVTHRKRWSAFSFGQESLIRYTEALNVFKPKYLYGYVSMLAEYGEFLKRTNMELSFPLRCVITTSEVLTACHRQLLENSFGCPVYNEYGCGEVGVIASQCEGGSLHVNSENVLVEILDGGRPCNPGELGEIVITELNNRAMPLIRYRSGDYASFSTKSCPCGRQLPVISDLAGRAYDLISNREGKLFHGEFFMYIFEEVKQRNLGVAAFQVIQQDYDVLRIKIRPEPGYGKATEDLIRKRIQSSYGQDTRMAFELVDEIRREPSGKMRLVVGMKPGALD